MAFMPSDLIEPVTLPGFFVAEERDWWGEELYSVELHNYDEPEFTKDTLEKFPIQWTGLVYQVEVRPRGDFHEIVCQQPAGPPVTYRVEPGALAQWVTTIDRGQRGLKVEREPHDGDLSKPIFWNVIGRDTSLKLRRLEGRDREKILGFELPADRYLLEQVLSSVVRQQGTRAVAVPVAPEEMRIEARTAELSPGERHRCVSVELWYAAGSYEEPFAELALIARSTEKGWSYGYGMHWLDACVSLAIAQPYQLPEIASAVLDPNRASLLIRLFTRGKIYRDTVTLFADPPGRLTSARELPSEMQQALSGALQIRRDWVGKPDSPESLRHLRVLEGLVEGGLSARLDSLIEAIDDTFAGDERRAPYGAKRESMSLEESLVAGLGHGFLARAEVNVVTTLDDDGGYGNFLLFFTFNLGECSVEAGFSDPPAGPQSSGDELGYLEELDYLDWVSDALDRDVLQKLGFNTDDVPTKSFAGPLFEPDVVGRQVVAFLEAFGLAVNCEVYVGVPAIDPSMPGKKVWGSK